MLIGADGDAFGAFAWVRRELLYWVYASDLDWCHDAGVHGFVDSAFGVFVYYPDNKFGYFWHKGRFLREGGAIVDDFVCFFVGQIGVLF